jgi:hypothetical protein
LLHRPAVEASPKGGVKPLILQTGRLVEKPRLFAKIRL